MSRSPLVVAGMLFILLSAAAMEAQARRIVRCVGPDGVIVYTNKGCANPAPEGPVIETPTEPSTPNLPPGTCQISEATRRQAYQCFDVWRWLVMHDPNYAFVRASWLVRHHAGVTVFLDSEAVMPWGVERVLMECPLNELNEESVNRSRSVSLAHRALAATLHGKPIQPEIRDCLDENLVPVEKPEVEVIGAGPRHR